MRKVKIAILLTFTLSLLSLNACNQEEKTSPVLNEKITKTNLPELVQQMADDQTLDLEDISTFLRGLQRIQKDSLVGMKISDIIDNEIKVDREAKIRQAILLATRAKFNLVHNFTFKGLQATKQEDKDLFLVMFDITNNGDRTITEIKGQIQYKNAAGQMVKVHKVELKELVAPNTTSTFRNFYPYNPEAQRDQALATQKGLKAVWVPIMIKYDDGSEIKIDA